MCLLRDFVDPSMLMASLSVGITDICVVLMVDAFSRHTSPSRLRLEHLLAIYFQQLTARKI
jgi:hypothetical protein